MIKLKKVLFVFMFSVKLFSSQDHVDDNQDVFDLFIRFAKDPRARGAQHFHNRGSITQLFRSLTNSPDVLNKAVAIAIKRDIYDFLNNNPNATGSDLKDFFQQRLTERGHATESKSVFARWIDYAQKPNDPGAKSFKLSQPIMQMCKSVMDQSDEYVNNVIDRGELSDQLGRDMKKYLCNNPNAIEDDLKRFLKKQLTTLVERNKTLESVLTETSFEASLKRVWACREGVVCHNSLFGWYARQLKLGLLPSS